MNAPDEQLAAVLENGERAIGARRERWPVTVGLLAAIAAGISFLLPWQLGDPGTVTLSRAGYAGHTGLLIWWGVALAGTIGGLLPADRLRALSSVVAAVAGAAIWYVAIQVAGTEVVDEGRSLFSRRELTAGPGSSVAVLAATVLLAAAVTRLVLVLRRRAAGHPTEFSQYELRDAVRRLRATRADRPVDEPSFDQPTYGSQ